jgi:hypothetical protein
MSKTKAMCRGCRDDFYNRTQAEGCWSFEKAKIVNRVKVGTWEPPPYALSRREVCLSCFNADGYSMLPLTDSRVVADVAATRRRWDKDNEQRAVEAAERQGDG